MQAEHGSEATASVHEDSDAAAYRARLLAGFERALADIREGRVIDDDELDAWLDAEFGPLE